MKKATIVISDLHFGDSAQLYATLRECMNRAIGVARAFEPDEIEVVLNGDAVAGRGIYRSQEMQNALQFGADQCWWCAWEIQSWQQELGAGRWVIVRGNHDHSMKENLAGQLVMSLRLLGVPAVYAGRTHIGNFSANEAECMWYDAAHGFGASSYYANSYESIRETWRLYIERSQNDNIRVMRFLRGHTHWLNVGQTVGLGVAIDTTGGWHRQERDKLPADTRNTGLLVYLHDGASLNVVTVEADRKLLLADTENPGLHYETMAAAAAAMQRVTVWAHERGLC
jgi:hypothetical protein